jgi:hypothetical protein
MNASNASVYNANSARPQGDLKLGHLFGGASAGFAVVETLKLNVAEVPGETVTVLCGNVQVAPVGTVPHVIAILIESVDAVPPTASISTANSTFPPAVTICELDPPLGITIWKSMPVPKRLMLCGLSPALSLIVRDAVLDPPAVGVNVTLTVQFAAGRTVGPQVVADWAKSPLFVPVKNIELMFNVSLPLFVTVTVWAVLVVATAWVVNVSVAGAIVAVAPVPNPNSVAVCGLPGASSAIEIIAELEPVTVGVNVTVITHELPEVKAAPHVFTCEKPEALLPVIAMLEMFSVIV